MSEPVIRVVELRKRFGGVHATNGINFLVPLGEFRAIIGPNGAGKSTFFNLLTGFLRPDSGQISFLGRNVTGMPPYKLFHLGISRTFQITSIFPDLTVLENLQVSLLSHHRQIFNVFRSVGDAHLDECRRLLDLVDLGSEEDRRAGVLSHGDQKKLELAVALGNKPRLLLLDEPTAGMAAQERIESIRLVHRIAKQLGITVIFTEHDMQVVFSVADTISVLHQGAIIAEGTAEAIRESAEVQQVYLGETAHDGPLKGGRNTQ